ncbi:EAL domain-containing protein [Caldimonas sp. KR1-144]|uniref:EAL domain-containing protein n=1 Tax=Caldimonas sp. KR1-144 TaxID=3400911 RepID=UPI003BFE029D
MNDTRDKLAERKLETRPAGAKSATRRDPLALALRQAIETDRLTVAYQPEVSEAGDLLGFEALARWHWAGVGNVPPSVFVPIAQRNGLMRALTVRVIEQALGQLAAWQRAGLAAPRVSINVAPCDLESDDFVVMLMSALRRHRVEARHIVLEITEKMPFARHARARQVLESLRRAGVCIALDDFGTGYSALAMLTELPLDTLKIDRGFLAGVPGDARREQLMHAVIELGRAIGLRVVVEGVELAAQFAWLAGRGIDGFQGHLFHVPATGEHWSAVLREERMRPRGWEATAPLPLG